MKRLSLIFVLLFGLLSGPSVANAQEASVNAIIFYSPSCPHCHEVLTESLPPIVDEFAGQLNIMVFDVSTVEGQALFMAAIEHYQIPAEAQVVPMLIVANQILLGSLDIPSMLPGIVRAGLDSGGIDWPQVPALIDLLTTEGIIGASSEEENAEIEKGEIEPSEEAALVEEFNESNVQISGGSFAERFGRDPVGLGLAIAVVIGMIYVLLDVAGVIRSGEKRKQWPLWSAVLIIAVGVIAAGYLSYVEVTGSEAVCGPVGDCNTVQQSPFATLFGFLPVGVLGLAGYGLISVALWTRARGDKKHRPQALQALLGLTISGTLFSVYLTVVEIFVISAACAWCLTSAVCMGLLLIYSASQLQGEKLQ